tara:strand:- start:1047 stop:1271 length:225 start_codon:yes stop_codon:yes gene_type:complete
MNCSPNTYTFGGSFETLKKDQVMKRTSSLLLIACWLVFLFVLSTVTLHIDSVEADKIAKQEAKTSKLITAHVAE